MNIRELAKEAGVSVATISRVINHPETVLPETRERVQAIIEKYQYNPKPVTRGKRSVAFIVPIMAHSEELIRGIQSVLSPKGILVNIIESSFVHGGTAACIQAAAAAKNIGLLVAGEPGLSLEGMPKEIPLVLIGHYHQPKNYSVCYINYREGAEKMVAHLTAMGRRRIWLLQSRSDYPEKEQITEGFRQAVRELALPEAECRILESEDSVAGGYRTCREIILAKKPPEALFSVTDAMAFGVMKAAREENIPLPQDLAIAGFTGSETAAVVEPGLTTMEHPTERLGAVSARRLIELIEDSALYQVETHEIVLKSKLIIRQSCGNRKEIYELFE